jgi:hypothetical protein
MSKHKSRTSAERQGLAIAGPTSCEINGQKKLLNFAAV